MTELASARPTEVYITVKDLLDLPRAMVEDIVRLGGTPILVDNASTYPPTVEWLNSTTHRVVRMEKNKGIRAAWTIPGLTERYVVTDCDLDLSTVPSDVFQVMHEELNRADTYTKVGLSLEINDIPDHNPDKPFILSNEGKYWNTKEGRGYNAPIDTTFAMYRRSGWGGYSAIRLDRPYTARHVPWYWDPKHLPEDYKHYLRNPDLSGISYSDRTSKARPTLQGP